MGVVRLLGQGLEMIRHYLSNAVYKYYALHQAVIKIWGVWFRPVQFQLCIRGVSIDRRDRDFLSRNSSFVLGNKGRIFNTIGR